jgi:hypothetical protein
MDKLALKKFVEENPKLVSMRPAGEGIFVLKYKKTVFYDNLWNDFLEECRGTIVDTDFNIVSRPFTKIYNYGIEDKAPVLAAETPIDVYRKVNGFMVAVTWHNGDILVSTTGSTDSDYVKMARELIDIDAYRKVCQEWYNTTFMFECVHRNDPHIVPEKEGMYLLGYRPKDWSSHVSVDSNLLKMLGVQFGTLPVEHYRMTVSEMLETVKTVKHEGYVFYTQDGTSAKVKSPYYLTSKWVARNPRTDKLVNLQNDIKKNLDEEYYPLVDAIRGNIVQYTAMDEQARLAWVRQYLETT